MRENCLQQFDEHWKCLENNNQVCTMRIIPFVWDINKGICLPGILFVSQTRTNIKQVHVREIGKF